MIKFEVEYDRNIIFHFNKKHLEDPTVAMWVIKSKGETFYVHHLESKIGFSTKETPESNHTKGSLKLRGKLVIIENEDKTLIAEIG